MFCKYNEFIDLVLFRESVSSGLSGKDNEFI